MLMMILMILTILTILMMMILMVERHQLSDNGPRLYPEKTMILHKASHVKNHVCCFPVVHDYLCSSSYRCCRCLEAYQAHVRLE
jgi:hypothetical protein